jgi:hypothetical protein
VIKRFAAVRFQGKLPNNLKNQPFAEIAPKSSTGFSTDLRKTERDISSAIVGRRRLVASVKDLQIKTAGAQPAVDYFSSFSFLAFVQHS